MKVGPDFPRELLRKIVKILAQANYPMSIDDIYNELVKAGHPTNLTSETGPLSLRLCVQNYIRTELRKSSNIREVNKGLVYLPRAVFTDQQECEKHHSQFTNNHPVAYTYHIEKILSLLKSESDMLSWAKAHRHDVDTEIRYLSYLFLIHNSKTSKYVSEALADNYYRVNCLALFSIPKSTKTNMRKAVKLLRDEDYGTLISSIKNPSDIFLDAYEQLARSNNLEHVKIALNGLLADGRIESLPVLVSVFEEMEVESYHRLFTDDFMSRYTNHISQVSSGRGQFPEKIKNFIIEKCQSDNPTSQRLAFLALKKKWLKSDLDALEKIETENNPIATGLKLEAIYWKKSENRFSIAESLLNATHPGIRNATVGVMGDSGSAPELRLLMSIFNDETKQNKYDIAILIEAIKKLQG